MSEKSLWRSGCVLCVRPPGWFLHTCREEGKWSKCKPLQPASMKMKEPLSACSVSGLSHFQFHILHTHVKERSLLHFWLLFKIICTLSLSEVCVFTKSRVTVQSALPGPQAILQKWGIFLQRACNRIPAKVIVYLGTSITLEDFCSLYVCNKSLNFWCIWW